MRTAERHQRLHLCGGAPLHQRTHEQTALRKPQPIEPVCKRRIVATLRFCPPPQCRLFGSNGCTRSATPSGSPALFSPYSNHCSNRRPSHAT
ncbi:hypothetical protein AYI69_g8122 [Smittium culicis]|uniref:Uncharacterized protein n=1 Tax=Smittium culicis TaxID=133412 RepID=A0A1R1XLY8_9FUNG|nr:hypothetical protein AYI69_g8122 [Smittium culicis]